MASLWPLEPAIPVRVRAPQLENLARHERLHSARTLYVHYVGRMAATRAGETRDRRWNLRVETSEDAVVKAASDFAETSYSNFVRLAAVSEARRVLADRTNFALEKDQWDRLTQLLDRPPQVPEGLRRLYSKPSVFE